MCGVGGAALLAVGLWVLCAGLALGSDLLWVLGVCLCDAGSLLSNMSFFALLWHLPGWQALTVALANCCYDVAGFLPVVLEGVMRLGGCSLLWWWWSPAAIDS